MPKHWEEWLRAALLGLWRVISPTTTTTGVSVWLGRSVFLTDVARCTSSLPRRRYSPFLPPSGIPHPGPWSHLGPQCHLTSSAADAVLWWVLLQLPMESNRVLTSHVANFKIIDFPSLF